MIEFLAGALTMAFVIAGIYFLRFWRTTKDRLFLNFAFAFMLLALNQIVTASFGVSDERIYYAYILGILGFTMILLVIVDKNIFTIRKRE
jgi:hypothetical protein